MATATHPLKVKESLPQIVEQLAAVSLEAFTELKLGMDMSPLHREWCDLRQNQNKRLLAICAPREHSKSQTFTVNGSAWDMIYNDGIYIYLFAATGELAAELLARVRTVIKAVRPDLLLNPITDNSTELHLRNNSRIRAAGAGKAIRGAHPDIIIGDDVLEEDKCLSALQRQRTYRWWHGSVSNMKHPGEERIFDDGTRKWFEPTRMFLVGTPFHRQDLLLSMRSNEMYEFRRYAAEFNLSQLVPGTLAVEVA